ncbi:MAG: hypothetical protein ACK4NR_03620 [Micavibrio sp.]
MSDIISIFLLPLLAGYILNASAPEFRFKAAHERGYNFTIRNLVTGIALVYCSYLYITWYKFLFSLFPHSTVEICVRGTWQLISQPLMIDKLRSSGFDVSSSSILALLFSVICWITCQVIAKRITPQRFKIKNNFFKNEAHIYYGGPLEKILFESHSKKLPLLVTLKSRKIYIGWVKEMPSCYPLQNKRHLRLLPMASGYRHDETLSLKVTQYYAFIPKIPGALKTAIEKIKKNSPDQKLSPNDSVQIKHKQKTIKISAGTLLSVYEEGLVIELDEIISATIWSEEIYSLFDVSKRQKKP